MPEPPIKFRIRRQDVTVAEVLPDRLVLEKPLGFTVLNGSIGYLRSGSGSERIRKMLWIDGFHGSERREIRIVPGQV